MHGDMPDTALTADTFPDLYESGITDLQEGLEKGRFTSVHLVKVSFRGRLVFHFWLLIRVTTGISEED